MLFTRGKKFFFTLSAGGECFQVFFYLTIPVSPNNFAFFKLNAHLNLSQNECFFFCVLKNVFPQHLTHSFPSP